MNMKKLITCAIAALVAAAPANAGSAPMGTITTVYYLNGPILFYVNATHSGIPACANNGTSTRWAISAATMGGQAQLSALMTAIARGKRISVQGTGTCSVWGDSETADYFTVED